MSNKRRIRRPPRCAAAVAQVAAQLKPGSVGIIRVKHDDWCSIWQGKACNCEPIVEPPELLVDEVA